MKTMFRLTELSNNFGHYFRYFDSLEEAKAASEHQKEVNYVEDGADHTQITEFTVPFIPENQEVAHELWSASEILNDFYFI